MTKTLSDGEKISWIRLLRSENVGPITFRQLIGRFASAEAALEALPVMARRGGRTKPLRITSKAAAEEELRKIRALGAELLAFTEESYPLNLRVLDDAPPLLIVKGHPHLLSKPQLAMVGARNASANGRVFANRLARELGEAGFCIASGLARGIDTAAHEGALASGTIAVLGGGIDVIYPPQNEALYEAIAAQGLLVSEMPPGTQPQARHFPRRNRIISGLSAGVVVIEASLNSGSLITARMAADQGREVMAVPGSPLDPRAAGCNLLIREGALLVEKAEDIIAHLAASSSPFKEPEEEIIPMRDVSDLLQPSERDIEKARVETLELLGPAPIEVDELLRQCHISHSLLSLVLLELDLAGRLERHPGNRVCLLIDTGEDSLDSASLAAEV